MDSLTHRSWGFPALARIALLAFSEEASVVVLVGEHRDGKQSVHFYTESNGTYQPIEIGIPPDATVHSLGAVSGSSLFVCTVLVPQAPIGTGIHCWAFDPLRRRSFEVVLDDGSQEQWIVRTLGPATRDGAFLCVGGRRRQGVDGLGVSVDYEIWVVDPEAMRVLEIKSKIVGPVL